MSDSIVLEEFVRLTLLTFDDNTETYEKSHSDDCNVEKYSNNSNYWYFLKNSYLFLEDEKHVKNDGSQCNSNSYPVT